MCIYKKDDVKPPTQINIVKSTNYGVKCTLYLSHAHIEVYIKEMMDVKSTNAK